MEMNQSLIHEIKSIILQSRGRAVRAIDHARVLMYWNIGKRIFEEEQAGKERAGYGSFLIKSLSEALQPEFGYGFSYRQLNWYRQFYRRFPIVSAVRTQFSWTHYKMLLSIDNEGKRDFYMFETSKNNWTARQLERQINSQLFERLLLSNNKENVLAVARGEKIPSNPAEIIKDPMVLEFLDLRREAAYYEKDLEAALITHLHDFLLELGNGFSFVARQKESALGRTNFSLIWYFIIDCFRVLYCLKSNRRSLLIRTWVNYRCTSIITTGLKGRIRKTLPLVCCYALTRMMPW